MAAAISLEANEVDPSNLTTYTFSSAAIGATDLTRIVVVATCCFSDPARTVSTLTIGGVSATLIIAVTGDESADSGNELWYAPVPTGTTADVVIVWSGSTNACGLGVWRIVNSLITTDDTASDGTGRNDDNSDPQSTTLNVPAGGVALGSYIHRATGGGSTWTELDEDYDDTVESTNHQSGASKAYSTIQSGITITADSDSSTDLKKVSMILASWGPGLNPPELVMAPQVPA